MKKAMLSVLFAVGGTLSLLGGDAPPARDPLELLIRNSTFVIDADVVEEPLWRDMDELFVVNYSLKLHCREAYLGDFPKEDTVVTIAHHEFPDEGSPSWVHKGQRCIFFLRRGEQGFPPIYETDIWFGVQPYRLSFAQEVKYRAKDMAKAP